MIMQSSCLSVSPFFFLKDLEIVVPLLPALEECKSQRVFWVFLQC